MHTKLCLQYFVTGKNFSFTKSLNKDFYFISEKLFYKAIENFFPVFA